MGVFRKSAEWVLRISLGAMLVYGGMKTIINPKIWLWAVERLPDFAQSAIFTYGAEKFIHLNGVTEVIMGMILLVWLVPEPVVKWVGLLSSIKMILIVLMVGVDITTFYNIGLIGPGLALFLML